MAIYVRNEQGILKPLDIPAIKGEDGTKAIDDTVLATDKTWSSSKIESGLGEVSSKLDTEIGEVNTSISQLSSKLDSELAEVDNKLSTKADNGHTHSYNDLIDNHILLVDYKHTSNRVVIPEYLDLDTGIYTTSEPHGLKDGDRLLLFVKDDNYFDFNVRHLPKELWSFNWTTWYFPVVINISETEFKLKYNSNNTNITYSKNSGDNNEITFGNWGFQVAQDGITFADGEFSRYKTLTFEIYAPNINKGYTPTFNIFNKALNKNYGRPLPFIPESYDCNFASDIYRKIVYKNAYYIAKFTLEENKVRQEVLRSVYGVTTEYRYMHPSLCRSDTDTFIHESYTDNVKFKDDIKLFSTEFKFLNGTRVRIYGQGENKNEN